MLRATMAPCDHGVKLLVDKLLKEDQRMDQNRRSAHRSPFVRPVEILLPGQPPVQACSKNISAEGIGLLTDIELPEGTQAKLRFHPLRGPSPLVLAELRWCDLLGEKWFISGWKLLSEARR